MGVYPMLPADLLRCRRFGIPAAVVCAAGLALCGTAHAQRLAVRSYDVTDGLAHGVVISLHQDVRGYLWLATYEGVSRFDGYHFTNYGAPEGLGHFVVNDIASDREGRVWAALNGAGVVRLLDEPAGVDTIDPRAGAAPGGTRRFTIYLIEPGERRPANAVNRILFDTDNRLWCVTDAGLYRARDPQVADGAFERVVAGAVPYFNNAAFADNRGRLWFGVGKQVIQVASGRMTTSIPARDTDQALRDIPAWKDIHTIIQNDHGRILAAETTGIYEYVEPVDGRNGTWRRWPIEMPYAHGIRTMIPAGGGSVWLGTDGGLIRYASDASTHYTTDNGLNSNRVRALLRDSEGNMWIGTEGSGVSRLSRDGAVSYSARQGLPSPEVYQLTEDRAGRMYAIAGCTPPALVTIENDQVQPVASEWLSIGQCYKSHLVRDTRGNTWFHTKSFAAQDGRGRWWFHTRRGLELSPGPQLDARTSRLIGAADGFPESFYSEMYQDAEGQLWVVNGLTGNLYVADTREPQPRFRLVARGLSQAEFMLRDRSGTLWLASSNRIWRWTNGVLSELPASAGLPAIEPRALFQDPAGRLWIGLRYHGVSMTADPSAAAPTFVNFSTANGLASDTVWSIGADDEGRIYLGTGKGLDQLDVATGRVRHFTTEDGVVGSVIEQIVKDRQGQIWVASDGGISKLDPRAIRPEKRAPPIFINRVQVAGEDLALPVSGARRLAPLELQASRNNLTIQFVGLSYRSDKGLRYQYRLEGAQSDWSAPGEQRQVNFANLASGRYRFMVRAIGSDGVESTAPATMDFRIVPPVYLRGWFIALAVLSVAALVYTMHQSRVRRLVELVRIRERIATDLHDDIGANLTRIAILSEVAQRSSYTVPPADGSLSSIARIARESVTAMSDIVWAISPDRDTLHDLVRKMRDHAEEVFETRDVALTLDLPDAGDSVRLGVNIRRDLYLIFKEAVNNAARHSLCTHVTVRLRMTTRQLVLEVTDDGLGFEQTAEHDGHGLTSMQRRAARLRAVLTLRSASGMGTMVSVVMPLDGARAASRETTQAGS
jgi:signal transduction histidine kinase/ligand-binding sensor domain-containing protein